MTSRPATTPELQRLRALARARWGLALDSAQAPARLAAVLARVDPAALFDELEGGHDGPLARAAFEGLSCGLTRFRREPDLLDGLVAHVLADPRPRRLRLWSAGCSTGPEPFDLALALLEALPDPAAWDVRILATDLSAAALAAAARGRYPAHVVQDLPADLVRGHLEPAGDAWRIGPAASALVRFERANLLDPPPAGGPFDAVLCRNVLVHLDPPARSRVLAHLRGALAPGGLLLADRPRRSPSVTPPLHRAA